jgi:hypothetical protein
MCDAVPCVQDGRAHYLHRTEPCRRADALLQSDPVRSHRGTVELFAFVIQNHLAPLAGEPRDYLVTVDSIETLTGLDFFSELPDDVEDRLESQTADGWPVP